MNASFYSVILLDHINITSLILGKPRPTVEIFKIDGNRELKLISHSNVFFLQSAKLTDEGNYLIRATNDAGIDNKNFTLEIQGN